MKNVEQFTVLWLRDYAFASLDFAACGRSCVLTCLCIRLLSAVRIAISSLALS